MNILLGKVENHSSFYAAIAQEDGVTFHAAIDEKFSFSQLAALIKAISERDANRHIYIEEFCSLRFVVLVFFLSMLGVKCNINLCVHNANKWVFPPRGFSIKSYFRHFFRRIFLSRAQGVIVVCNSMARYLMELEDVRVRVVPFRLPESFPRKLGDTPIFVIPGNVEDKRRDYRLVLEAIDLLARDGVRFQVHFLGKLVKSEISPENLKAIEESQLKYRDCLVVYENRVSDSEFDEVLKGALAIVGNLKTYYLSDQNPEIYGQTKETGIRVLSDSLGIPCFLASGISVGRRRELYYHYSTADELAVLMLNAIEEVKPESVEVVASEEA